MSADSVKAQRSLPGERLYAEHTGRFVRLIEEHPEKALAEYGFTFIHSVDESDAATFLKKAGLSENTWREGFLEAVAFHRRGKLDDAEKRYKELLSKSKKSGEIDYNLAALYLQKGDFDVARKHLDSFEKNLGGSDAADPHVIECKQRIAELRAELRSA